MTLSSFLLRPALTSVISGLVTNSVVTASPAILVGLMQTSAYPDSPSPVGNSATYNLQVNSGALIIWRSSAEPFSLTIPTLNVPNGVDCPNGISVTTSFWSGSNAGNVANATVIVNYILK